MQSKICALVLIGILGIVPVCYAQAEDSNTSIEEVKKESQDLLKTIGAYTADKKDKALEKAKEGLKSLDKHINALETSIDKNWDKMSEATRKKSRENLRELRKQRNKVAEWYGSMKASSADAWDHMKEGFSDAYKALGNAWEKSEKEFKSNGSKE